MEAESAIRFAEHPEFLAEVVVGSDVVVAPKSHTWLYVEDRDRWRDCPRDRWLYNRLMLAERLGYPCGPAGTPFPTAGAYCSKAIVNLAGMGRAQKVTHAQDVPPGYCWTPWFLGPQLSVNYERQWALDAGRAWSQWRAVEAVRCVPRPDGRPAVWIRTTEIPVLPGALQGLVETDRLNVEFIGDFVIEAHLRLGYDFAARPDAVAAIVVWRGDPDADAPGLVSDVAGERIGFRYVT